MVRETLETVGAPTTADKLGLSKEELIKGVANCASNEKLVYDIG
jgi:hypothetical protein